MSLTTEEPEERYRAPALDKGLDILELLASTEESLSQGEIAKALERTPNEIYRMLDRLVRRHYVARTAGDRYELTLKLFALAHQHAPMRRLVSQAMPELRTFAREAEQACHLAVYDRGSVAVVAQVDPPGYWAFSIRVGARVGLFNTGSGHVLLAFASPRERAFMLQEHELLPGERRPHDLDARLEIVRQRGYELMASQQTVGVQNLSAPVLGSNGTIVAALTCPFLVRADTISAPPVGRVLELLCAAARKLSPLAGGTE
jgi:DNA-binding IclR family transcriptional regulator